MDEDKARTMRLCDMISRQQPGRDNAACMVLRWLVHWERFSGKRKGNHMMHADASLLSQVAAAAAIPPGVDDILHT